MGVTSGSSSATARGFSPDFEAQIPIYIYIAAAILPVNTAYYYPDAIK